MSKRALIIGVGGQDGSYLADILLERGYEVYGLYRHSSVDNLRRVAHCRDRLTLLEGDVTDIASIRAALLEAEPGEVYHVADQDNVDWSFKTPKLAVDVTYGGAVNVLQAVLNVDDMIRVFLPVSATMFGMAPAPQTEETPLAPTSPYACAKAAAFLHARYMREVHGVRVSCGIMYNHDSPRRGSQYLLQKVCAAAKDYAADKIARMPFGGLDAKVDVGHARSYMVAAVNMLQPSLVATDLIISSGNAYTLRQLCYTALMACGVRNIHDEMFEGKPWTRPGGTPTLIGDCTKARQVIGLIHCFQLDELVKQIVEGSDA